MSAGAPLGQYAHPPHSTAPERSAPEDDRIASPDWLSMNTRAAADTPSGRRLLSRRPLAYRASPRPRASSSAVLGALLVMGSAVLFAGLARRVDALLHNHLSVAARHEEEAASTAYRPAERGCQAPSRSPTAPWRNLFRASPSAPAGHLPLWKRTVRVPFRWLSSLGHGVARGTVRTLTNGSSFVTRAFVRSLAQKPSV